MAAYDDPLEETGSQKYPKLENDDYVPDQSFQSRVINEASADTDQTCDSLDERVGSKLYPCSFIYKRPLHCVN